jgi:peptidoglycan/LPS O-acetylase OafA/YrhL
MTIPEFCGWLGAILVLYAYFMISTGRQSGDSASFQLINIVGAAMLIYYTYHCQAYASMIVNVIWVFIGLSSFIRFIKKTNIKLYEVQNEIKN